MCWGKTLLQVYLSMHFHVGIELYNKLEIVPRTTIYEGFEFLIKFLSLYNLVVHLFTNL